MQGEDVMGIFGRILVSGLLVVGLGCEVGPRSGRGLRLPDGDIEKGALTFHELGCDGCHDVSGRPSAPQGERAETIVKLGGEVTRVYSYGELVTSIVRPSHRIARGQPKDRVTEGGVSKMELENFNDRMTVAQLIDLVAFLQSTYERRSEPLYIP
jgi:hypothetical protein